MQNVPLLVFPGMKLKKYQVLGESQSPSFSPKLTLLNSHPPFKCQCFPALPLIKENAPLSVPPSHLWKRLFASSLVACATRSTMPPVRHLLFSKLENCPRNRPLLYSRVHTQTRVVERDWGRVLSLGSLILASPRVATLSIINRLPDKCPTNAHSVRPMYMYNPTNAHSVRMSAMPTLQRTLAAGVKATDREKMTIQLF